MELGALTAERGVRGLKTKQGATVRVANLNLPVLWTVVEQPDGRFVPVVFLRSDQQHLLMPLANRGIFVMGGGI